MNDYFTGHLARGRQADYLREVEHDELIALAHRADGETDALTPTGARAVDPTDRPHRWADVLGRLMPARLAWRSRR